MPMYEIEQYELWTQKYRVNASSRAEAILKLDKGQGVPVDDSAEFIETEFSRGMMQDENEELTAELKALGYEFRDDAIIESIRDVECLDDEEDEKPFRIYLVLGEKNTISSLTQDGQLERPITEYAFATQAELQAFVEGIDAMEGYLESATFDSKQEALDYIKEVVGEEEIVLGADDTKSDPEEDE